MTRSLRSAVKASDRPVERAASDRVVIGRLGAPRGLDGDMKLIPLTDFADRFDGLERVFVDDILRRVDYVKTVGNNLVVHFADVNSRDSARSLTNKLLTVDRADAAPLSDGEFYTFDIIGLDVIDLDGNNLGVVTHVLKTGSNDVYVARSSDGRELLIPALKRVVGSIDLDQHLMTIDRSALEEV